MTQFPPITHVIYDLDGLLLDTEPLQTQVNQAIARRYGKSFSAAVRSRVAGRNALDTARIIVEDLDLPLSPEAYVQERKALIYGLYPGAQALPGALNLTKHLATHNIPQAVATSSSRQPFELKITHHQEWFSVFDCIVVGDDPELQQGKPAPDIFLIAAKRLGAKPEQCLVFEDAIAGMEAAIAAGMSVVVVPNPEIPRHLYHSAHQLIDSLTDFEPQLWQLPV
ncbi:MAG: HAD-IA family hydrolase [Jaaginema sp. PMC 1079.18]|nr:HAD-IA family hydrolase [Jaaginema sp. PMC 1080.18]MEC4850033.1 HAD-IA family hydrolase [Jaaginema sp. PMC 1079.18]MEC4867437.1 HAD-IA family hydrolase [Jaaginema sp. PMC 1078.18]